MKCLICCVVILSGFAAAGVSKGDPVHVLSLKSAVNSRITELGPIPDSKRARKEAKKLSKTIERLADYRGLDDPFDRSVLLKVSKKIRSSKTNDVGILNSLTDISDSLRTESELAVRLLVNSKHQGAVENLIRKGNDADRVDKKIKLYGKALSKAEKSGLEPPPTEFHGYMLARFPTVGNPDAPLLGTVLIGVHADGLLRVAAVGGKDWTSRGVGLALWSGSSSAPGTELARLHMSSEAFDPVTSVATGWAPVSGARASDLLAAPSGFHLRAEQAEGLPAIQSPTLESARPLTAHFLASGSQLVPPAETGRGAFTLVVTPDGEVDLLLAAQAPIPSRVTEVLLHAGRSAENGTPLAAGEPSYDPVSGTVAAAFEVDLKTTARLYHDASAFHVIAAVSEGADLRGQILSDTIDLWSTIGSLSPDAEARAAVTLEFTSSTRVRVTVGASPAPGVESLNLLRVYGGGGQEWLSVDMSSILASSDPRSSVAQGFFEIGRAAATRILALPSDTGVRVEYTSDAGSTQSMYSSFRPQPKTFYGGLSGGAAEVEITSLRGATFRVIMADPLAAGVQELRLYDGRPGAGGTELVELLGGATVNGNVIEGSLSLSGTDAVRILAAPESFQVGLGASGGHQEAGPLFYRVACENEYAPPIEGLWSAGGSSHDGKLTFEFGNFNILAKNASAPTGIPPSCAEISFDVSVVEYPSGGGVNFVQYSGIGEYEGDEIEFTLESSTGSGSLDGLEFTGEFDKIGVISAKGETESGEVINVEMEADEFRPVFGGIWVEEGNPDCVLRFEVSVFGESFENTFEAVFGGRAELRGIEVTRGARRSFTGGFSGNRIDVEFGTGTASATFTHANRLVWSDLAGIRVFIRAGSR